MTPALTLERGSVQYRIGQLVAETETYRVYVCEDSATHQRFMLQIAAETAYNGGLERAAYILGELRHTAELFEAEYARQGGTNGLGYERLFPSVVDSFVWEDQGRRRANILTFNEVGDIMSMVPLANVIKRDRLRVDLRTSAWIMGRLLKLLGLAHGEGITVRTLSGKNILLVPAQHFAIIFDWSSARTHQTKIPARECAADIASAAKAVFVALGGNPETGDYPYFDDGDDAGRRYIEFLWGLINHRISSAEQAHSRFYKLVNEIYEKKFYQFTTQPL